MIIQKKAGVSGSQFVRVGNCYICYNEKAWVNQELIKNWIDLIFPQVVMSTGKAIVWDSCRAHTANLVKKHLKRRGTKNVVIPEGLTPYVQAGDLGVYKSFKDKMSPLIAPWKASGQAPLNRNGNPKPPSDETVCHWITSAWRLVNANVILNSIKAAGFSEEIKWMIYKHDVYNRPWNNNIVIVLLIKILQ